MAFCPKCGAPAGTGRFCASCGAALPVGAESSGPQSAPPGYAAGPGTAAASAGMTENLAAALCYLLGFITGVLFLVLEPYSRNRTIRFHAFQSIFLNIAVIVLSFVLSFVDTILLHIPFLGLGLVILLTGVFWVSVLVLWLFLMFKAYNNQKFILPVVGPMAEKQA